MNTNKNYQVFLNRYFQSTQLYLRNFKKYNYDAFILGVREVFFIMWILGADIQMLLAIILTQLPRVCLENMLNLFFWTNVKLQLSMSS